MINRLKFIGGSILMALLCLAPAQASKKAASAKEAPMNISSIIDTVIPHIVNNKGEKIDYKEIKEKPYVMYYFSAAWCPPCRKFTPVLVDFYNKNGGKENFEIVFVSADRSAEKMKAYMTDKKMPWVAIPPKSRGKTDLKKISPRGIPHLVLVDKKGNIIAKGQGSVLKKLSSLLPKKDKESKS
jgi:nucleoredoxin